MKSIKKFRIRQYIEEPVISMGVQIRELAQKAKKVITMENLMGKRIAIDAFNTLYQFLAIIRGIDGTPLKDYSGNITSHLSGLFYRTINILEHNIRPIYVFDGKPNELKMEEIKKRREQREKAKKQYIEAIDEGDEEEARKYAQGSAKLTTEMIEESKELLRAMGIPVIQAMEDGEAQAAYLVIKNDAYAVGSQDYDAFLFGAPRIIRNLSQSRTKKVKNIKVSVDLEWYSLDKLLEENEITHNQLVDIGILVGVDFFGGVPGIGAKTALNLIKKYESIEGILENDVVVRKNKVSDYITSDLLEKLRKIFLNPNINKDYEKPRWSRPDPEKIIEILVEKHNFNKERIQSALNRIIKKKGTTQITMDNFIKK